MKTIFCAFVAALYVSQFLFSLITPWVVALPVPPGNDVKANSSTSIPYSRTTSAVEVFCRHPETISFTEELKKLGEMRNHIESAAISPTDDKVEFGAVLCTFRRRLELANSMRARFPREDIHKALKELCNVMLLNWRRSPGLSQVLEELMGCIKQTKPSDGSLELPQQRNLDDLRKKIVDQRGFLTMRSVERQGLNRLFLLLQDTLTIAYQVTFPYDKLVVDEAVLFARSAVEMWTDSLENKESIRIINGCLTLIWVTPAIFNGIDAATKRDFPCSGTEKPHSGSTAPSESYAELRVSGLLADSDNPINALLLPGIMELVPDNGYRANWKAWSVQLCHMEVELKDSRSSSREEALRQLALSQEKLRNRVHELSLFVPQALAS